MKQVILIRKDLELSSGKIASQASHAVVNARKNLEEKLLVEWENELEVRIVLEVENLEKLKKLKREAEQKGINVGKICDAGLTEVEAGTLTACAIGPDKEEKIDEITGHLSLYK